jgi:N-acetylglucosaminyldiphosphoundecaprenol N-acetyl-beta-D-mannosaminyltransferase
VLPTPADARGRPWTRYRVGPVVVDAVRRDEVVSAFVARAAGGPGLRAGYVNAHVFERLHHDAELARAMERLDLVFCDGWGALLGLRALGAALPDRMTPPDFVDEILAGWAASGGRVFVLGDEIAAAAAMASKLHDRWPGIAAGHHHGFYSEADEAPLLDRIRSSGAGLVLAGMGTPRQELWIANLGERAPELSALAVGGLYRWYTGLESRGPRWLTDHGFEWLCRLVVQPRKVARRYLVGLPRFAFRVVSMRIRGARAEPATSPARPAIPRPPD